MEGKRREGQEEKGREGGIERIKGRGERKEVG